MKLIRYIRDWFRIRREVYSLIGQLHDYKEWNHYVNESIIKDVFYKYSKGIYKANKSINEVSIKLSFMMVHLESENKTTLAPKLTIKFGATCCNNMEVKMISKLWKSESVRYSVFKSDNKVSAGEGTFEDCIVEIKEVLNGSKNGKV